MSLVTSIESASGLLKLLPEFIDLQKIFSPFFDRFPIFLVGGCVRDGILKGQVGEDLDCVVESEGGAKEWVHALKEYYPELFSNPHPLGREYPIWQIVFDKSWGSIPKGTRLEVADTQSEMFPDPQTRARVTRFGKINLDALRRDFSVNALYWDFRTQSLQDPSGLGLQDLGSRTLRSPQPQQKEKNFSDDPLRIVRLFRFHAQLEFAIDTETLAAALSVSSRLKILSSERIRDELLKVFKSGRAYQFFKIINEKDLLSELFPELIPMVGCTQDARYHSEGDVWVHTLLVMKNADPNPLQQLTALLHDVGKPASRTEDGDRIRFLNHEKHSVEIAQKFLKRFKFSADLIDPVLKITALHLRGSDVELWASSKPARKLLREIGPLKEEFLRFVLADSSSSQRPDGSFDVQHVQKLAEIFSKIEITHPVTQKYPLSGHEIMKILDLKPGPQIKVIQDALREAEDAYLTEHSEAPSPNQLKIWAREAFLKIY